MSANDMEPMGKKFPLRQEEQNSNTQSFSFRGKEHAQLLAKSNRSQSLQQAPVEMAGNLIESFDEDVPSSLKSSDAKKDLFSAIVVLSQNGDHVMAAEVARRCLEFDVLSAKDFGVLINVFKSAGSLENLEESLRRILDLDCLSSNERFDALKELGNTLLKAHDFDGAEENYFKAYRIDPNSDSLLVNMGTLEFRKQSYQSARERFVQAVEADHNNDKAWVGLGLVHSCFGDFKLCLANLERALDINPQNLTALSMYSETAFKHGSLHKILEYVDMYFEKANDSVDILTIGAKVSFVIGQLSRCESYIDRIVKIEPNQEEAKQLRTAVGERRGANS